MWTAFPDMHVVVEDQIAEGDKVVSRLTIRGTLQGDFLGIPPTGKQVSVTGIGIDRIENDKFVESWGNFDALGLMQELGAIPQMA
jgi:predicted ester cyclase